MPKITLLTLPTSIETKFDFELLPLGQYEVGLMFSDIEFSMPYIVSFAAMLAAVIFRECKRKAAKEVELRKFYRLLTAFAECLGMFALIGIVTVFGRSLVTYDKETLTAERDEYHRQAQAISVSMLREYCLNRESDGTVAFRANFTAMCSALKWQSSDKALVDQKARDLEAMSILSAPLPVMLRLKELQSNLQGLARSEYRLAMNHGPWNYMPQSALSVSLLLLALVCALFATAIKTGKASHEWYAGRHAK